MAGRMTKKNPSARTVHDDQFPQRTTEGGARSAGALTRRGALFGAIGGVALTMPALALAAPLRLPERALSLHHLHTGERVNVVYWADGGYVASALREIDRHLRDFRTGEVREIDRELLDVLFALHRAVGSRQSFEVISGFRSRKTNAALAAKSTGVAKKSLHTRGKAIDIRLPKTSLKALRRAAVSLKAGGVGYYPASGFIHVDVGRVRYW